MKVCHLAVVAALALPGCRQVFGIDSPTQIDAPSPATVTGTASMPVVTNDSQGMPVATPGPGHLDSTLARLDDGTLAPIDDHGDGTFSFQVAHEGQRYAVTIDGIEYQSTASHLVGGAPRYCRTDAVPASIGTTIQYNLTDTGSSGFGIVQSTGCWMYALVQGSTTSFTVDWTQVLSEVGARLLRGDENDDLYFTRYLATAPGIFVAATVRKDRIIQADRVATAISGSSGTPGAPTCVHVATTNAAEQARFDAAGYGATAVSGWEVRLFPLPEVSAFGEAISAFGVPTTATSDVDAMVQAPAIMPGTPMLELDNGRVDQTRTSLQTRATTYYFLPLDSACQAMPGAPVALPRDIALAGVALASDGVSVTIDRTHDAMLTWNVASGVADADAAVLYQINAMGPVQVAAYDSADGTIAIDAAHLVAGTTYAIELANVHGYPRAAAGDFTAVTYPYGISVVYTSTFTVR